MTTPGQNAPDGSWQFGDRMGQEMAGLSQAQLIEMQVAEPRAKLLEAVDLFNLFRQQLDSTPAWMTDGQNALRNRLDLLEQASGYGSAVMSKNWNVPYNQWVVLPFDAQLGPMKGAAVTAPAERSGWLTLKKGGLWRVDTHFTVQGYSMGVSMWWNGAIFIPITTYSPIFPKLMLEAIDSQGTVISKKQFDLVSDIALNAQGLTQQNSPRSGAFQMTVLLDQMPPEDDPSAPDHWVHVRLSIWYEPIYTGTLNSTTCKVLGGTKRSSLIASCWSRDVDHINYADEVPDGGDLG
ncbi:hypothetical protein [Rhodococcus zopfii]|uniref:hypothetical protein n=1 Tax=Rhodococcus zopfii TaxID=43772 RepID=UPI003528CA83